MSDTNPPQPIDLDADNSGLSTSELIMRAAQQTLAAMEETQEPPAEPPAKPALSEKIAEAYGGDPRRRRAPRRVKSPDVVLAPVQSAPEVAAAPAKPVAETSVGKEQTAPKPQTKQPVSAIQQRVEAIQKSTTASPVGEPANETKLVDPPKPAATVEVEQPTAIAIQTEPQQPAQTTDADVAPEKEETAVETSQPVAPPPVAKHDDVETSVEEATPAVRENNKPQQNQQPATSSGTTSAPKPPAPQEFKPKAVAPEPPAAQDVPAQNTVPAVPENATGFRAIALSPEVQEAVAKSGYDTPTEIQAEIIPYMLDGRDVLAQSQTGTGKTAGFALPILSQLDMNQRSPQVLVLAPTRELAIQVANSFSTYASSIRGFSVAAVYGGSDYATQFRQLKRGVQVVVGTPGRTIDHIKRGTLDLTGVKCLVLDEADEMLNMGFLADVQFVLEKTPDSRQVALFSATLPAPIRKIAEQYLSNPARITVKTKTMTADSIRQRAVLVHPREKIEALKRFLEAEETDGVIVFTKTREATMTVAEQLVKLNLKAVALNGDMPQKTRERTIHQLKAGYLDILVATDVAARGLDVTRISHVFNFDMPHDSESYVHRIGRTGRAGRKGEAIIFLSNSQRGKLRMIERVTKQQIEIVQPPSIEQINEARVTRFKKRIIETIESSDATMFEKMLTRLAEKSGQPLAKVAAALAHMCQNGQPFFLTEPPKYERKNNRGDRERGGHNDRGSNSRGPGGGSRRIVGPPEAGMTRYRIEVGWKDGVKPGNIVGAVANEGGIDGRQIGQIKINDAFSTIDLPSDISQDVQNKLKSTRVAGQMLQLRLAGESDNVSSGPPQKSYGGKPSYGKKPYGGGGNRSFSKGKNSQGGYKRKFKKK